MIALNSPYLIYEQNRPQLMNQWGVKLYRSVGNGGSSGGTIKNKDGKTLYLSDEFSIIPYRIVDIEFPTGIPEFEFKSISDGRFAYESRKFTKDVRMKIREDTSFSILKYFENWIDEIYVDKDQTFRKGAETATRFASVYMHSTGTSDSINIDAFKNGSLPSLFEKVNIRFNLYDLKYQSMNQSMTLDQDGSEVLCWEVKMVAGAVERVTPNDSKLTLL